MSPKKVRLVADAVRGNNVESALATLRFMNKQATKPVAKVIESAIANAVHNFELQRNNLFVKELRVDEAPTIKRWMPRAFGRATPIRKRMSHIMVVVAEIEDSGEKSGKRPEVTAPVKVGEMGGAASEEKADTTEKSDKKKKAQSTSGTSGDEQKDEAKTETKQARSRSAKGASSEAGRGKGFASKVFRRKSG